MNKQFQEENDFRIQQITSNYQDLLNDVRENITYSVGEKEKMIGSSMNNINELQNGI